MIKTAASGGSLRELAYRESDGLEVTLLWDERDDQLAVTVRDTGSDEFFALRVAHDKALDVFYHPYFYARSRTAPHANLPRAA